MDDVEETYVYIARHVCGGISFACVDLPDFRAATAKEVAGVIRQGRAVERVTIEVVWKSSWCKCARIDWVVLEEAAGVTVAISDEPR